MPPRTIGKTTPTLIGWYDQPRSVLVFQFKLADEPIALPSEVEASGLVAGNPGASGSISPATVPTVSEKNSKGILSLTNLFGKIVGLIGQPERMILISRSELAIIHLFPVERDLIASHGRGIKRCSGQGVGGREVFAELRYRARMIEAAGVFFGKTIRQARGRIAIHGRQGEIRFVGNCARLLQSHVPSFVQHLELSEGQITCVGFVGRIRRIPTGEKFRRRQPDVAAS